MTTSDEELSKEDAQAQVRTWIGHDRDRGFIPNGDSARAYSIRMDDNIFEKRIRRLSLEVEVLEEAMAILPADDEIRRLRCQQAIEVARHRMEFAESGRQYLRRVSEDIITEDVRRARAEHFLSANFLGESENASTCALVTEIECVQAGISSLKSNVQFFEGRRQLTDDPIRRSRCQQLIDYNLAKVKLNEGILRHLRGL